jgi:hypothetical protein
MSASAAERQRRARTRLHQTVQARLDELADFPQEEALLDAEGRPVLCFEEDERNSHVSVHVLDRDGETIVSWPPPPPGPGRKP